MSTSSEDVPMPELPTVVTETGDVVTTATVLTERSPRLRVLLDEAALLDDAVPEAPRDAIADPTA